MVQLHVDIGGRPGVDCRGFCEYCYFKHVKEVAPFGCRYCAPWKKGCDYCTRSVKESYAGFRPLKEIADDILARLQMMTGEIEKITISGGGDPSCYPQFIDLIELLASMEAPIHIGYTSGKGFDDPDIADFLVDHGLAEVSFTVFSVDPQVRKKYMHDPTPEASLQVLERLCRKIDVYAATVILPGVNDGDRLVETCEWLDEKGAKGLILMRFANKKGQGLILGNAPVIPGQHIQTPEEFSRIVTAMNDRCRMKVSGTPLWDPSIGSPFVILNEPDLIARLPRLERCATVISGSIAAPYIKRVLDACGGSTKVIGANKEIACLITIEDLAALTGDLPPDPVVIPGRAFVHDREAEEVLSGGGTPREVIRGPDCLTADAETSMGMSREEVLALEMEGFSTLIQTINRYGRCI